MTRVSEALCTSHYTSNDTRALWFVSRSCCVACHSNAKHHRPAGTSSCSTSTLLAIRAARLSSSAYILFPTLTSLAAIAADSAAAATAAATTDDATSSSEATYPTSSTRVSLSFRHAAASAKHISSHLPGRRRHVGSVRTHAWIGGYCVSSCSKAPRCGRDGWVGEATTVYFARLRGISRGISHGCVHF